MTDTISEQEKINILGEALQKILNDQVPQEYEEYIKYQKQAIDAVSELDDKEKELMKVLLDLSPHGYTDFLSGFKTGFLYGAASYATASGETINESLYTGLFDVQNIDSVVPKGTTIQ